MTDLYDQRIDAMKARERVADGRPSHKRDWAAYVENVCDNARRLAAYRRKRAAFFGPRTGKPYLPQFIT